MFVLVSCIHDNAKNPLQTFIAHFAEEVNIMDNVEDYYKVFHDGRELSPSDWPRIVALAKISRVRVQVKR